MTLAQISNDSSDMFIHKGLLRVLFNGSAGIVVDGKPYALSSVMEVKSRILSYLMTASEIDNEDNELPEELEGDSNDE